MGVRTVIDPNTYSLGFGLPATVDVVLDFGESLDFKSVTIEVTVESPTPYYYMFYSGEYSFDNINWFTALNTIADNAPTVRKWITVLRPETPTATRYVYFRFTEGNYGIPEPRADFYNITVITSDLIPDGITHLEPLVELPIGKPWLGYEFINSVISTWIFEFITSPVVNDGGNVVDPNPTSTNIIMGNVKKLNLPFKANVVAVSLGVDPIVLARTTSDEITGDYVLDVYPHIDELLLYVAPDYGRAFSENLLMTEGQIIHPTIPNKLVYVAQNDGLLGNVEPNWGAGEITSNEVTFLPTPLYRPLMNGFVKPTITVI